MREIKFRVLYNGKIIVKSLRDILTSSENNFMFLGSELMQYTGLTDCNGKEIYEGDIVQIEDTERGVIEYDIACFRVRCAGSHLIALEDTATENIEVIGNIYEQKELLNDKQ